MAYKRVNWEDAPSKKTYVCADNLNIMDKGIEDLERSKLGYSDIVCLTGTLPSQIGWEHAITMKIPPSVGKYAVVIGGRHLNSNNIWVQNMGQFSMNVSRAGAGVSVQANEDWVYGNKFEIFLISRTKIKDYSEQL